MGGIIGTRNRLIHGYEAVELDRLWETVQKDLPSLVQTLNKILDARTHGPTPLLTALAFVPAGGCLAASPRGTGEYGTPGADRGAHGACLYV